MNTTKSEKFFEKAQMLMPGGVNSPVRSFQSVNGSPIYIEKANGAFLTDADGNKYMDFCSSWGAIILGHAYPSVVEAVQEAISDGLTYGTCCRKEIEIAELISDCVPYIKRLRFVNSGTEATMTALRLARGFTGRDKILKFEGCYHGHCDYLLVSAGSGLLTEGISSSAGVPRKVVSDTLVAPYNDIHSVKKIFEKYGHHIAAVIVEPIAGNMGLVLPISGFLETLRDLTSAYGALLIFDEVITGFRFAPTTYGVICDITPDLTCLGKIIGGGMPIGAIGGEENIMKRLAPLGDVYQAGTLSGNPVALSAGIVTLKELIDKNPYHCIEKLGSLLAKTLNNFAKEHKIKLKCNSFGGLFTLFFSEKEIIANLDDVKQCDTEVFACFHKKMLQQGFYLSPSQFELDFISASHTEENIRQFIESVENTITRTHPGPQLGIHAFARGRGVKPAES